MPSIKQNRGPVAGPVNREALIEAARVEFAEQGALVPLSRIARRAGVGQGSLYRHFPDRASLAAAVFSANLKEITAQAVPSADPLAALFSLVEDQAAEASALIEMVAADTPSSGGDGLKDQLREVVEEVVDAAACRTPGPSGVEVDDVMTAVSMLALSVAKAPQGQKADTARRARRIISEGLFAMAEPQA